MQFSKLAVCAALLLPATAMVAVAAAPHPAFKLRHDNFEAMGRAMKSTFDQFKKPTPNLATIRKNANVLAAAATKVKGHFPVGTGPEAGVKTEALAAIWARPADFAAATDRLVDTTKGLQAAAAGTDLAKIQAAAGAVGGSCKNCHDSFRKPRG
ncbi:MAG: cytochrome c [Alphaproteobacteria bacterium]|nr:cytochrome c [Alphaproteobacteria bacterium]